MFCEYIAFYEEITVPCFNCWLLCIIVVDVNVLTGCHLFVIVIYTTCRAALSLSKHLKYSPSTRLKIQREKVSRKIPYSFVTARLVCIYLTLSKGGIGGSKGAVPSAPPKGPDSFVLAYKFYELSCVRSCHPLRVWRLLRKILDPPVGGSNLKGLSAIFVKGYVL